MLCPSVVADIMINEIMFNPTGSDNNHEWIEIYNNWPEINLSDLKFNENNITHKTTLVQGNILMQNNTFAIIADDAEQFLIDYPQYNKTLFDSSFSLSNSGELLELQNATHTLYTVHYNGSLIQEGKSLSYFNGSWSESVDFGGTPGKENSIIQDKNKKGLKISIYLADEIYLGMSYTKLFKIENLDHTPGITDHINLTLGYNISNMKQENIVITDLNSYVTSNTGEFEPDSPGNYTLCGWIINATVDTNKNMICKQIKVIDTTKIPCNISVGIFTEKIIYENSESVKFNNLINNETLPFIIEYWVEDLFGNIIKNKYNTTNTNQKSFTTTIDNPDMVCIIKNNVYPLCNDINKEDNSAEKLFIIKGEEPQKESRIDIEKVYTGTDNKVKFGESFEIRVKIYKGDETKNQVLAWVEDNGEKITSETTKVMLYDPFTEYILTIPLQLKSNCDDKYPNKEYNIIVEAFDIKEEQQIQIEGKDTSLCSKTTASSSDSSKNSKILYSLVEMPNRIMPNSEFLIEVKIINNDKKAHEFSIWSYVYRGSKSYSGDREFNKKFVEIPEESSLIIPLNTKILDAEPGVYKLKVKIKKDNQKTENEITRTIEVASPEFEKEIKDNLPITLLQNIPENLELNTTTERNVLYFEPTFERIVYEGTNYKAKKLIPYFIIFLLFGFAVFLIVKKL